MLPFFVDGGVLAWGEDFTFHVKKSIAEKKKTRQSMDNAVYGLPVIGIMMYITTLLHNSICDYVHFAQYVL